MIPSMKAIKIITLLVLLSTIGFFVFKWLVDIDEVEHIKPSTNLFQARIKMEIDSLRQAPVNTFSNEFYQLIQYRINYYHSNSLFDQDRSINVQWQDILSKNLYSVYVTKFIEQAFYVFNGSEWSWTDLRFINNELNLLQGSSYFQKGSLAEQRFNEIQTILSKYYEIANFIHHSNNFSYSNFDLDLGYPLDEVSQKINRANTYLQNRLDNAYVNNCIRLKSGLRSIPLNLFRKHFEYLKSKIRHHSQRYFEFEYQAEYSTAIYTPLKNEIDALNQDFYGIKYSTLLNYSILNSSQRILEEILNEENLKAYQYFQSLILFNK
jgi:hypothetical protein